MNSAWAVIPKFTRYECNGVVIRNKFTKRDMVPRENGTYALTNDKAKRVKGLSLWKVKKLISDLEKEKKKAGC